MLAEKKKKLYFLNKEASETSNNKTADTENAQQPRDDVIVVVAIRCWCLFR
jgi:hypothetical protein